MTLKKLLLFTLVLSLAVSIPLFSKDRVAVLDFEAKDIAESDALAIADIFRSDLVSTGKFVVLERGHMQSILKEHEFQMEGLINDASASKIGELLAVNYLFLGNLSKFGNKFLLVIDKINIETGEIEKSIKKNAVNLDEFLELSAEAALEMTGSSEAEIASSNTNGYDSSTLTDFVNQIGIFNLLDFKKIEVNKATMQSTDLELRRDVYASYEKKNSVGSMLVNAVTFGIGGNFMQGFNELAWTSIGTTAAFALSFLTDSLGLKITTGVLYAGTYTLGIISPFLYEAEYNQYMKDTLLVY